MEEIEKKIAKVEEEISQLKNKKRRLLNQRQEEERKRRTRRLIERGAILESRLELPEEYENEQIKEMLDIAFRTQEVKEYLSSCQRKKRENLISLV